MNKVLMNCAERIESLDGDIIDFRVGMGDIFIKLIKCTNKSKKQVWGLTNYQGLGGPSEHDLKDYATRTATLKKNTLAKRELVNKLHHNLILYRKRYTLIENSTFRTSLEGIPDDTTFSLAFMDLFQYTPTALALNFLHDRLVTNGVIIINNYDASDNYAANKAVKEFLHDNKQYYKILPELIPSVLCIKKIISNDMTSSKDEKLDTINEEITIEEQLEIRSEYHLQESTQPLTIACVLKSGGNVYNYNYVNALSNAVARYVTVPYTFTCLTDDPRKFNNNVHKVIKLKHDFPKWWSKIELFRPEIFDDTSQIFFLDLDTVITNNINDIVSYDGNFCGLRDFYKIVSLGSGLLSWKPSDHHHIYYNFLLKSSYIMANTPEGDQKWIDAQTKKMDYFQDLYGRKIISWKKDCIMNKNISIPKSASIICFHGVPKPHEITHNIITSNWQP